MNPNTRALQDLGQSLWIDNITRTMLADGTLRRYIADLSITGLTSNPTIFEQAMAKGDAYDAQIAELSRKGQRGEALFFALAVQDLREAADLFKPVHDATHGVDGWVSLEVSPLIAHDARQSIAAAAALHAQAARPNVFIKIPGTSEGVVAIEESIFAGVPVNVTLLFSRQHYLAVAEAYLRGIERRIAAGLDSPRWRKLQAAGAHPQRLLLASTGAKDPKARDTLYVEALAAPDTVDTMPEKTLHALADHGRPASVMPADGGDAEAVIAEFRRLGVDDDALAARLQEEGAASFAKSWRSLLAGLQAKIETSGEKRTQGARP